MIRGKMQKHASFQSLPFVGKKELAGTVEDLHQRTAATRMRGQFLTFGKREENDAYFRAVEESSTHNARGGNLHRVDQLEGLSFVSGEKGALTHEPKVAWAPPCCLDGDQARTRLAARGLADGVRPPFRREHAEQGFVRDLLGKIGFDDGLPTDLTPLRTTAIAATLRSCQLFAGLPAGELETIASFTTLRSIPKDAYLFREGDPSEGFYVVQKGAINVHRVSAAGKEQIIYVFRAGESLAEASMAVDRGYPANARAIESSSVVVVPKAPFLALLARRPDLGLRMLGSMSQHLRVLVGLVEDLTLKDVETRVVNWLVKRCPREGGREVAIQLKMTKRVLAAELGTSSETLSRTFARLRDDGILEVKGNTLRVRDVGALRLRFGRLLGEG
jgi:CRP-like cAMP-binding protein